MVGLFDVDPETYVPHPLHADERAYPETNCYADIVIELLHARGDEPLAALGRTVRTDFEGDQWTFFKPDPHDLEALYGLDIHEAQPYRALPDQIAEQLESGRTLIVELDSWFLPDTESTAYRREHVKSSAVMQAIDLEKKRLQYFHNRGLYELTGEDFDGALRVGITPDGGSLPPYAEVVRFDAGPRLTGSELREEALRRLRYHFARRPTGNPFARFAEVLREDLPRLLEQSHADYHAYAFATVRMAGSAFELCAAHIAWLFEAEGGPAAEAFGQIVTGSKALSFKLARRRAFDPAPSLVGLAEAWDEGFRRLHALLA